MVSEKQKIDCCGCGACVVVCRNGAIRLSEDEEGFLYPEIDAEKCTKCGLCDKACMFGNNPKRAEGSKYYIAQHIDEGVCTGSTSGGMYTAFSDAIIERDGCVYAPEFSDGMVVTHQRITTKAERDYSRGSKYVQSVPNGYQHQLINDLKDGKAVAFFGTPCQVAGVISCVPQKYTENLYCIDVVCNGVGSPMVWREFVRELEKKYHKKLKQYIFRPKTKGYLTTTEVAVFEDGSQKEFTYSFNRYNPYYYDGLIMRPSCTNCKYTSFDRVSDITIGDFSKEVKGSKTFIHDRGCSTLLINTEKGEKLLALSQENLHLIPSNREEVTQIRLIKCTVENPARRQFLLSVSHNGLAFARNRKYTLLRRMKICFATFVRKIRK